MATASIFGILILIMSIVLPLIIGCMLLFMSRTRGLGYPACGSCSYNVTGTLASSESRCPECGKEFAIVGVLPPKGIRGQGLFWFGVALIVTPLLLGALITMSVISTRRAAAQAQMAAVAAQQRAIAILQATEARNTPPDPELIASYRTTIQSLSMTEAANRLNEIDQTLAKLVANVELDVEVARKLNSEREALIQHLDSISPEP